MFSKRELEGYVEIDHRESPGFTPEQAAAAGLRGLDLGKGARFQSPTRQCCGCERFIILNPDRTRARNHCAKCDSYLCDQCAAEVKRTGVHKPFKQIVDEFLNAAAKGKAPPSSLILP